MEGSNIFLLVVQPYSFGFFIKHSLLSLSLSLNFVPGGVSQVLRKVTESVLSHNFALYYIHMLVLGVKLTFFCLKKNKKMKVCFFFSKNKHDP